MSATSHHATSIIPAQPGFEAGHIWINETVEIEKATLLDLQHKFEPIIAWVIVAEVDGNGEPMPLQEVRPVGVFGDIGGEYFIRLPSGMIKPRFDDGVCSLDAFQEMYLDRQKERERLRLKNATRAETGSAVAQAAVVHGIALSSRHDQEAEIVVMTRMARALDPSLRPHVEALFCDSKAGACYTVFFRQGTPMPDALQILDQLECASGGHNGIWVQGAEVNGRNPNWPLGFIGTDR